MVSTSLIDCESLEAGCQAILDQIPLTDARAARFIEEYPPTRLFELIGSELLNDTQVVTVSNALSKVFGTAVGVPVLVHADTSLMEATFHAAHPELRRLAVTQFSQLVVMKEEVFRQHGLTANVEDVQRFVLLQLLIAVQDPDTGVANTAVRSLVSCSKHIPNAAQAWSPNGEGEVCAQVSALVSHKDSAVRLRVMGLLLEVAGSSDNIREGGLIDPLLRELSDTSDSLSCLATLGLLRDLLEGMQGRTAHTMSSGGDTNGAGTGLMTASNVDQLCSAVLPLLMPMLQDPMLFTGAMLAAVALVHRAMCSQVGLETMSESVRCNAATLFGAIKGALSDHGDASVQDEADVLDAVGQLCQNHLAAQMLAEDKDLTLAIASKAVGRSPHPEVRLAALHALASTSGVERATQLQQRSKALLSSNAEDCLRVAIYSAVSSSSSNAASSPAAVLLSLLQQPFAELRIAVYRFLTALCFRTWFAAEACRCSPLIDHLLKRSGPASLLPDLPTAATSNITQWHYACLTALHATVQASLKLSANDADYIHTRTLQTIAEELHEMVRAGPFGSKLVFTAEPQVATAQL